MRVPSFLRDQLGRHRRSATAPRWAIGLLLAVFLLGLAWLLIGGTLTSRAATRSEAVGIPPSHTLSAPQSVAWSNFTPTDWVHTLPFTSSVTVQAPGGLTAGTAAYAISTDAGGAWTAWSVNGLTINGETLIVTDLRLPDSANGNQIQFRIEETGGALETSPVYTIPIDTTPPTVTLLRPDGGEVLASGQSYTITWQATDPIGLAPNPITLRASYDGGGNWSAVATAIANIGIYTWTPPAITTTQALIEVAAVDLAGNRGAGRSNSTFTISGSAPGAPQALQASPAQWTNLASFSVSWTNPAELTTISGAWYKLDLPPTTPTDGSFVTTTNSINGIVPGGDGIHPVYVWLQDQFGRADHTRRATTNLYWDRTPPPPPSNLRGTPDRTWTNRNSFTEQWTNPPDLSGIVGAYYRIDRPGAFPTDGIFVSTTNTLTDIAMPSEGRHDLYIWLLDAAGNTDHNSRNIDPQVFWFDSIPPASFAALDAAPSASGWYSLPVRVTFTATDGLEGSGVDVLWSQLDTAGWTTTPTLLVNTEGIHQVAYYATDRAGNRELTRTLAASLDTTPPTVTLTPERTPQPSGWYTAPITVSVTISDALSGPANGFFRLTGGAWQIGARVPITADGDYPVEVYGEDRAGNRSPTQSARVKLDATPPTTAYLIEGTQGQNGWYVSPLTVRLIATDNGSGVAATFYRINDGAWQMGTQFQLTNDGSYTLAFYSVDNAGNVESSFPVQVKLDTVAPAAPIAATTTPAAWSRENRFSLQWANPTDLSGIAGVYYRLDQEPASATDGVFSGQTNRLDNLTVPTEGAHRLYLWLRDGAGNADYRNRTLAPLLRYDATPPTTTLQIQGVAGDNGWYRSPLNVHLSAIDVHSGVALIRYRLNSGEWVVISGTNTSLALTTPDKHLLEYAGQDIAGNVEPTRQVTLRIDPVAPASPINLRAAPSGWQRDNSFSLVWNAPLDLSGIAGAYVRLNRPPTGPTDGVFFIADEILEGLQMPNEGKHDVYVWLRDRAGNSDQGTMVALPSALWYDGTPPITIITPTGTIGANGWYVGPVTFAMSASDGASGVAETRYQVDDGAWQTGHAFTIDTDGQHIVRIASADAADNQEAAHLFAVAIDRMPPVARFNALDPYQPTARFAVTWWGGDAADGSGLQSFDLQARDGYTGAWQDWLMGTTQTSANYDGVAGHTYFFRIRARDRAGNLSQFTTGGTYAVTESVRNGGFDTGNFTNWTASGILYSAVVPTDGPMGDSALAARLGSPIYGPSTQPPGNVPVGNATIAQTISIPALNDVTRPTLAFWYRVFSYDVLYSQRLERYVDDLEVSLRDSGGQEIALLMRAGNPSNEYGAMYDSGWRYAIFDLSPYAGQTVQLTFASYNREDNLFNTWSFVDSIQVQDWPYNRRVYLPLLLGSGGASGSVTQTTTPASIETRAMPAEKTDAPPGLR